MITPKNFIGFSPKTLEFLKTNQANNSKLWFENHKKDYDQYVLKPLQNLVMELGDFMLAIDPILEMSPKVNKTISRIYRDTRFSEDKSLFKNNMWITFKRPIQDWKDAPCYFFEIFPDWYRYGMGYYSASKETMDRFRASIDDNPDVFLNTISSFSDWRVFQLEGEKYKKILDPTKPENIQDWYQRKSFYLTCNKAIDDILISDKLSDEIKYGFGLLAPFYKYLWDYRKPAGGCKPPAGWNL